MQNIDISGIKSRPVEIIALTPQESSPGAYGGKRQVGPFGDVLDINFIKNSEDKYTSTETKNILSSAQLFIAKAKNAGKGTFGTTNITSPIVNWSETNTTLTSVMSNNNYYFIFRAYYYFYYRYYDYYYEKIQYFLQKCAPRRFFVKT